MTDVLAIILGGGQGKRLYPLTYRRSKPAVPIGGKYRLIDIPVSNCLHAGIRRMSACRQPLIGTSIRRYLPPIGTAGLERVAVSGNSREPCPPPRIMASVSLVMNGSSAQPGAAPRM